jgi:hypothetical protein
MSAIEIACDFLLARRFVCARRRRALHDADARGLDAAESASRESQFTPAGRFGLVGSHCGLTSAFATASASAK